MKDKAAKIPIRGNNEGVVLIVEAVLALVILATGVLALLTLFNSGLNAVSRATSDTQAALFADSVFNGLRARSLQAAETNGWENFWENFQSQAIGIPVAARDVWVVSNMEVRAGGLYTNIYTNYALHADVNTNIVNHALRYTLDVHYPPGEWTNRVNVTLEVWMGESGSTNDDGLVFYTEFNRQGDL